MPFSICPFYLLKLFQLFFIWMEICGSLCSLTLFGLNSLLFFWAVCFHWIICPPIHLSVLFVHSKNTRTIDGNNWCSRFVYRKWVNHKRKWMQQNIYKTKWIFVCGLYIWIYLVSFSTYTHSTTTTQLTCVIEDSPEPPAYIFWNHNNAVSINFIKSIFGTFQSTLYGHKFSLLIFFRLFS